MIISAIFYLKYNINQKSLGLNKITAVIYVPYMGIIFTVNVHVFLITQPYATAFLFIASFSVFTI